MAVLRDFDLELALVKCAAFSIVPSRKSKKMKILSDPQFIAGRHPISQLGVLQAMCYLGICLGEVGPVAQEVNFLPLLKRITRAPLKPQQRLVILRTGRCVRRFGVDLVFRTISKAFFHCPIKQGGLGIQSFDYSPAGVGEIRSA